MLMDDTGLRPPATADRAGPADRHRGRPDTAPAVFEWSNHLRQDIAKSRQEQAELVTL